MKKRIILFTLLSGMLFGLNIISAQNNPKIYAKFLEEPPMKSSINDLLDTNFKIEFKSKKQVTIYLSLRKKNKPLANYIYTGKSKKPQILTGRLTQFKGMRIPPGKGYSYKLLIFEGEKNDWSNKLGEVVVNNVAITSSFKKRR